MLLRLLIETFLNEGLLELYAFKTHMVGHLINDQIFG